ncbi:ferritin-like domain-containing protein [Ideonella sp.]|uniref:ferritin-like domain-containing protein n=1 Tax=Ideonella sp. TaxID=1929293 RepID=UPI0037BE4BFB
MELRTSALAALCEADPAQKVLCTQALRKASSTMALDTAAALHCNAPLPGRPAQPIWVDHTAVPKRSLRTPEGRAAMVHALCHIEFNAINLALDAIWRFADMPERYYLDWLQVADEEALHFSLLREHLQSLGFDYGDFEAHGGLWSMAERTAQDVLARMALVPRTLEARGLDATPAVQTKFRHMGDHRAADILDIILRDEIGHVAIGNHWYGWLCQQASLDPLQTYADLAHRHAAPRLRKPFNLEARRAAGFSEEELIRLDQA